LPVGRQGMLGRAHRRPLVRPQPTPHSQPLHTRSPGPTPPQTPRQRTSAPRAGSAAGQPAVAAGCDRSLRDRPHPSARRPCGATVTGHPSAGTRNWHTPSTMGDQLGQPRSTRKRRTVNPPIVPARYNLSLPFLKAGRGRPPPAAVLGPGQLTGVAGVAGRKRLLEQAPDRMGRSWPDRAWRPPATRPRDATGAPQAGEPQSVAVP
jgi:hypothetical protein